MRNYLITQPSLLQIGKLNDPGHFQKIIFSPWRSRRKPVYNGAMERFVVLSTFFESEQANKACEALEAKGIPVLVDHMEVIDGNTRAYGYRVLVPAHYSQEAVRLTQAHN